MDLTKVLLDLLIGLLQYSHIGGICFDVIWSWPQCSQSLLFAVDPHLALHVVENPGLQGWWAKTRVWSKAQLYQVSVTTRVAEHKCIRQHLECS